MSGDDACAKAFVRRTPACLRLPPAAGAQDLAFELHAEGSELVWSDAKASAVLADVDPLGTGAEPARGRLVRRGQGWAVSPCTPGDQRLIFL